MKNLLLISLFLTATLPALANDSEDRVSALVNKSRQTRTNIEKNLNKRELASIKESENELAIEFSRLMKSDADTNWFAKVDDVIKEN